MSSMEHASVLRRYEVRGEVFMQQAGQGHSPKAEGKAVEKIAAVHMVNPNKTAGHRGGKWKLPL